MGVATLDPGARILVLDDDVEDAEAAAGTLRDADFRADSLSDNAAGLSVDSFLADVCAGYDALVCDHVLSRDRRFGFTGAELVSRANQRTDRPLPAVLLTSHRGTDQTGSISRWLSGIPAVVDKPELTDGIVPALDYTVRELRGDFSEERRCFLTPIEVLEVFTTGEVKRARVVVVGWHMQKSVWMPLEPALAATGLNAAQLEGRWLEAKVNCNAKRPDDLYYRDITIAPDLPEDWFTS
ncbi:response regulator [Embleya sp. NPDC050493]|uniref:response regulator n=1 Tax=Embleya sp. NPDC050493 TaxID=3363989 RepID=UPI0037B40652